MSYDIHITRAKHWTESAESPITIDELKSFFADKNEFEYSDKISVSGPFGEISIGGDFFNWKSGEGMIPFQLSDGKLTLSGADEGDVIDKMKEIASELNAKVQGDEGEIY